MKKGYAAIAAAIAITGLAGCGNGSDEPRGDSKIEAAKASCLDEVKALLRDPSQAEFQGVVTVDGGAAYPMNIENYDGTVDEKVPGWKWHTTGEVNAPNGFGGMTGFMPFSCNSERYEGRDLWTRVQYPDSKA